jgi:phage-related protein
LALVGEAHIIVRAITDGVKDDIKRGFSGGGTAGRRAGESIGQAFKRGFNDGAYKDKSIFGRLAAGLRTAFPEAERTAKAFRRLTRVGYALGPLLSILGQSIYSLIGGLVALGGSVLAAVPSMMALVNTFIAMKVASSIAKFALGGVGKAVQQASQASQRAASKQKAIDDAQKRLTKVIKGNIENLAEASKRLEKANINLAKATRQAYEEFQQLGFDAEDAAIAEKRAAMELEDARAALARVQDLPPNSRARKEAELAFAEAELNLRKAKDRVNDLTEEQNKYAENGIDANEGLQAATEEYKDAQTNVVNTIIDNNERLQEAEDAVKEAREDAAANDPYAGLTPSQKQFAQFLVGIKGKLDELKEQAASGFLPVLEEQMKRLMENGFYDVLKTGFKDAGIALGGFTKELANAFSDPKAQKDLGAFFESLKVILPVVGKIIGNVFKSFLTIIKGSTPATERFLKFLNKNTGAFSDFLDSADADGTLETFFNKSEAMAEKILGVFGNVFKGIGGIIMTNLDIDSPGGRIVGWLEEITGKFADFSNQPGFTESMDAMATNFIAMGDFVIGLVDALGGLAVDTNVADFFNKLTSEGLPIFETIVSELGAVGPSLGDFIVNMLELIAVFTDSEAPSTFFDTLNTALGFLNGILKNDTVKGFIDGVSKVFAFSTAISLIGEVGKKAFDVVIGNLADVFERIDKTKEVVGKLKDGFSKVGEVWKSGPMGKVAIILGVIVAALVTLYNTNEEFRAAVDTAWASIKDAFGQAMTILGPVMQQIGDLFKNLFPADGGGAGSAFITTLSEGLVKLAEFLAPLIPQFAEFIANGLEKFLAFIEELVPVFMQFVEDLMPIFQQAFEDLAPVVETLMTEFGNLMEILGPMIAELLPQLLYMMSPVIAVFVELAKVLGPVIGQMAQEMKPVIQIISEVLAALVPIIATIVTNVVKFLIPVITGIVAVIKAIILALPQMAENFKKSFTTAQTIAKTVANVILGAVEGFINGIINGLNWLVENINKIKFKVPDWVPFIGGKEVGFNLGKLANVKLPRIQLAEGGTVYPSAGGTIAQIAEAGRPERVEPLDPSGLSKRDRAMIEMLSGGGAGSSITVNVYPSAGMDERDLAEKVSRQLQLMMRKGATA